MHVVRVFALYPSGLGGPLLTQPHLGTKLAWVYVHLLSAGYFESILDECLVCFSGDFS